MTAEMSGPPADQDQGAREETTTASPSVAPYNPNAEVPHYERKWERYDDLADAAREPTPFKRDVFRALHLQYNGTPPGAPGPDVPDDGQVDLSALLERGAPKPVAPSLLCDERGVGRFYFGRINRVLGDYEAGKTRIALAAVAEHLQKHDWHVAAFVDLDENTCESVLYQMQEFGVSRERIRPARLEDGDYHFRASNFHDEPFMYFQPPDLAGLVGAVDTILGWYCTDGTGRPKLVVVFDSMGQLTSKSGLDSNNSDHIYQAVDAFFTDLAHAGACVIVVDHPPKSGGLESGGATAKDNSIAGSSIHVKRHRQFALGHGGSATLWVGKDRPGGLRAQCPPPSGTGRTQSAGLFTMEPLNENGTAPWRLELNTSAAAGGDADAEGDATLAAIRGFDGEFTVAELMDVAGVDRERARYAIDKLAEQDVLVPVKEGGRGRGNAATWRLAAEVDGEV